MNDQPTPAEGMGAKRLFIKTYGCQMNVYDSERMADVLRPLGYAPTDTAEDADFVNPHGGAIALGHPLGMSGARLALTATHAMETRGAKRALCTLCVGVGQGVALALERV